MDLSQIAELAAKVTLRAKPDLVKNWEKKKRVGSFILGGSENDKFSPIGSPLAFKIV